LTSIQKYHSDYLKNCISIFQTNTPTFFAPSEQNLFQNYLLQKNINYYVLLNENTQIVGAGGYGYNNATKTIDLTWGMIDFNFHNKGFGTILLNYRISQISMCFPKTSISLNTTQHTFKFYRRFGFRVKKITENYYVKGLHRYDMIKVI
jgi:ribosomal protein S18 acetylase RimI-like enzyme